MDTYDNNILLILNRNVRTLVKKSKEEVLSLDRWIQHIKTWKGNFFYIKLKNYFYFIRHLLAKLFWIIYHESIL